MSLDCRIENFERKIFVKGEFSVSFLRVGKNTMGRKMRKMSKQEENGYVNWISGFFTAGLWKKDVDKPVEIVEKLAFSTAKPGISSGGPLENPCHFPEIPLVERERNCVTETGSQCPISVFFAEKVGFWETETLFSGNGAKACRIFLWKCNKAGPGIFPR